MLTYLSGLGLFSKPIPEGPLLVQSLFTGHCINTTMCC